MHPFIVASFNAQSVKGDDMACKHCEISTFIKDNGVDLFFVTETWLSAQADEAKTVELAPSGFDVKSFPRQSRSPAMELLQYTNLLMALASLSNQTLILLTQRSK